MWDRTYNVNNVIGSTQLSASKTLVRAADRLLWEEKERVARLISLPHLEVKAGL